MQNDRNKSTALVRQEGMRQYGFGPEVMKQTRVCGKCGTSTTSDSMFCPVCGARLPRETLFEVYRQRHLCCPYCGALLDTLSEYCPHCGKRLK